MSTTTTTTTAAAAQPQPPTTTAPPSFSVQNLITAISTFTATAAANLIKLLPTGTVFLFQFLNPLLTNNGKCHVVHKYLSSFLIAISGFSCFFTSFTDSYIDTQGNTHYAIVTTKGLWPTPSPSSTTQDFSTYRLRLWDFVHAFFSLIVFAVVALLDPNSVECFYPSFESTQKVLLVAMPPVIGVVSSSIFVQLPNNRHGFGYPFSQTPTPTPSSASASASA